MNKYQNREYFTSAEDTGQGGGENNSPGILGRCLQCFIQFLDELQVEGVHWSLVHGDSGQTIVVHGHVHVAATCARAHGQVDTWVHAAAGT